MNLSAVGPTGRNTAINAQHSRKAARGLNFSQVLNSQTTASSADPENPIDKHFPNGQVSIKTVTSNLAKINWERNDFPFWISFKESTDADRLSSWKPTGPEPRITDGYVQKQLRQIEFGAISILIPESLQQKMNADPVYAERIWTKIADWKTNYDQIDNAMAASYGCDPAIYQLSKSYCLQLDETGNVDKHVVVSGGLDDRKPTKDEAKGSSLPLSNKTMQTDSGGLEINAKLNRVGAWEYRMEDQATVVDYSQLAPYIMPSYKKR
jgi:hypothetical protein